MFKGVRKLQLDEACKLVEHFNLEDAPNPVTIPIAALMVYHVARGVGADSPDEHQVLELAKDLAAFVACAADPQWRGRMDALAQILQGIDARRRSDQDSA